MQRRFIRKLGDQHKHDVAQVNNPQHLGSTTRTWTEEEMDGYTYEWKETRRFFVREEWVELSHLVAESVNWGRGVDIDSTIYAETQETWSVTAQIEVPLEEWVGFNFSLAVGYEATNTQGYSATVEYSKGDTEDTRWRVTPFVKKQTIYTATTIQKRVTPGGAWTQHAFIETDIKSGLLFNQQDFKVEKRMRYFVDEEQADAAWVEI